MTDEDVRPLLGFRSARGWQAWMLVLPVDALMLLAPIAWSPDYWKALVCMAALSVVLLSGGGRYRARLHLSVLDELPTILARLLVAAVLVSLVYAVRHDGVGLVDFLLSAAAGIVLVVAGRLGLVVLSPVLGACALAARVLGGPCTIERRERVGRDGRVFDRLAFRSVRPAALTELPQLWNVLRGELTFVGPRPERPEVVATSSSEHPRYHDRHRVRAGMTGLAQVSGVRGADAPISDRTRFDNYYIENWSLWLDAKVLLRTVSETVLARGRW